MSNHRYGIRVKQAAGWQAGGTVCVGISVGSKALSGAKLAAVLQWAGRHFDRLVIDLSDTLYRHNTPLPSAEALVASRQAGNAWLSENAHLLAATPKPDHVSRWDWLAQSDFTAVRRELAELSVASPAFRVALDADILAYTGRYPEVDPQASRAFLIEEAAVHTLMARVHAPWTRVYTGASAKALNLLRAGVPGQPGGLERERFIRLLPVRKDRLCG